MPENLKSPSGALDADYAAVLAHLAEAGCTPGEPMVSTLQEARARQDRYFEFLNREPPAVASVRDLTIEGPAGHLGLRIYRPDAERVLPVMVFVRGAGWWAGSLDSHDCVMRLGALQSGCAVVGVDYHRSPEHRYPTQLEELLAVIRWLRAEGRAQGLDASRLVLWGESAGATLALLAATRLRDTGQAMPGALLLFYGNFEGPTPAVRAQSRWFWQQYLGGDLDRPDPAAIPARQELAGLPPTWLGVGELDPLLTDTLLMHERMRQAGVPCALRRYPGLPHAFMNMNRLFGGAVSALAEATGFAKTAIAAEAFSTQAKETP